VQTCVHTEKLVDSYQLITLDRVVGALVHAVRYESRHGDEVVASRWLLLRSLNLILTGIMIIGYVCANLSAKPNPNYPG